MVKPNERFCLLLSLLWTKDDDLCLSMDICSGAVQVSVPGSRENGSFSKAKGGKEGEKWWGGLILCPSRWRKGNKQKLFVFPQWESLSGQAGRRGWEAQAGRLADGQSRGGERWLMHRGCVRMEFPVCSGSLQCVSPSCTEGTRPAHSASSSGISPILLSWGTEGLMWEGRALTFVAKEEVERALVAGMSIAGSS